MCAQLCNSREGEEAALHVIMSLNEVHPSPPPLSVFPRVLPQRATT
jgi:hypothetical protein